MKGPRARDGTANPALPGMGDGTPALMQRLNASLAAKGPDYEPRTHHFNDDGTPKFVNRLVLETSPYLLQHAHNPVNWYPWGNEAFDRARRDGKPVLLSVGYSTCHWCHVMERESFEDVEIARYINKNYVAIKVDREERPDVDDVYMKAVRMLTGRGGWSMTVLLTPDREPFFGGTYFPARDGDRGARKGFLTILQEMKDEYDTSQDEVVARAQQISQRVAAAAAPGRPGEVPGPALIDRAARTWAQSFDPVFGGFGRAPKFRGPSRSSCSFATTGAQEIHKRSTWLSTPCRKWPREECMTRSAAVFTATRPTRDGSCRTSRRCCTTTLSWCRCTCRPTSSPSATNSLASHGRRFTTSSAR